MSVDSFLYRVSEPIQFNAEQRETLNAILDTFIAPLTPEHENALVHKFKETHTEEQVRQYCRVSSSSMETFETIETVINRSVFPEKRPELLKLVSLLSSRAGTFILTGHYSEFKNLTIAEREKVVLGWRSSYLPLMKTLYKTFMALAIFPAYTGRINTVGKLLNLEAPAPPAFDKSSVKERLPMLTLEEVHDNMTFDAIVVGSGAGGGVVASQLAQAGKSVLVIEKGVYYHEEEFGNEEYKALENLYELGGAIASSDSSITMLAGSVFGGGTTVNWSASLKPKHFVREEWAAQGLSHFISPKFSNDLDRVYKRIGASTEGIVHNKPNQILINGCKALGYPVADIPQNTDGKPHQCSTCFCGCTAGIKNGTMNSWLRDAHQHNAKFLDRTKALRVLTEKGKAVGVEVLVHYHRKVIIKAHQVVVSAGSLQSPGVLLRSGLKNKNIGKNLRFHPVTSVYGYFEENIHSNVGSIMTAVSDVAENVENDGYGCKLEVPVLHVGSYSTLIPWGGQAAHKEHMLKYQKCSSIIAVTRDKDSIGAVSYDKDDNFIIDFKLSNRDRKSVAAGISRAIDILIAAGAREVFTSHLNIENFKFNDGEESSVANPRFIAWKNKLNKYGFPEKDGANVFSAHQMGSNRMGVSPSTSVVKPTGETWEIENLYVADASVFPTASGVNPMVTTEAVALHIADCMNNDHAKL